MFNMKIIDKWQFIFDENACMSQLHFSLCTDWDQVNIVKQYLQAVLLNWEYCYKTNLEHTTLKSSRLKYGKSL